MFLDADNLTQYTPAEVLDAASRGHLGIDHRFLHALLDRRAEALPAVVSFAARDRSEDSIDLAPELVAIFRVWKTPESIPFLLDFIQEQPDEVPDEAVETLAAIGAPALEPLLTLYETLDESDSGEIAFILANLHVRDERILKLLVDRLDFDLSDTVLLLGIYGDPSAIPALANAAKGLGDGDARLKSEIEDVIETLRKGPTEAGAADEPEDEFDVWDLYPEHADLPVEELDEDERAELLSNPVASTRAAAAASFFNRELTPELRKKMLELATGDDSAQVRARAWEALTNDTEDTEVVGAMLTALRKPDLTVEERGGLLVGLAPEADRNEVRKAIVELYDRPGGRAKALEAMWRSVHPSFRDYFSKHLDDSDVEVQRGALWGVGYYGLKGELERVRKLFDNEELRTDALFAYTLALPAEVSRGRMKGLVARIEKDAHGLSEMEEELVKAALDERLMLAGKEPVFRQQED